MSYAVFSTAVCHFRDSKRVCVSQACPQCAALTQVAVGGTAWAGGWRVRVAAFLLLLSEAGAALAGWRGHGRGARGTRGLGHGRQLQLGRQGGCGGHLALGRLHLCLAARTGDMVKNEIRTENKDELGQLTTVNTISRPSYIRLFFFFKSIPSTPSLEI